MENAHNLPKKFLSRKEACQALGIGLSTLIRRINDRSLPHVKLGGRILIPAEALNLLEAAAFPKEGGMA